MTAAWAAAGSGQGGGIEGLRTSMIGAVGSQEYRTYGWSTSVFSSVSSSSSSSTSTAWGSQGGNTFAAAMQISKLGSDGGASGSSTAEAIDVVQLVVAGSGSQCLQLSGDGE